jgi:hypothetical protein
MICVAGDKTREAGTDSVARSTTIRANRAAMGALMNMGAVTWVLNERVAARGSHGASVTSEVVSSRIEVTVQVTAIVQTNMLRILH